MKKRVDKKMKRRVWVIALSLIVAGSMGAIGIGVFAAGGSITLKPSAGTSGYAGYSEINIDQPRNGEIYVTADGDDVDDGDWVKDGEKVSIYVKADKGYYVDEIRVNNKSIDDSNRAHFYVDSDEEDSYNIRARIYDKDDRDEDEDDEDDDDLITTRREETTSNAKKGVVTATNPSDSIARSATTAAITKADGEGEQQAKVLFRDTKVIQTSTLKAVADTAAGRDVVVCADTMDNGRIAARLYIDPAKAAGASTVIKPGIETNSQECKQVKANFARSHTNKNLAVVRFDQQGSFGVPVEAAVNLKLTGFNTDTLVFNSYDPDTNKYSKVPVEYHIDSNGYLHFTVEEGKYLVISDEELSK